MFRSHTVLLLAALVPALATPVAAQPLSCPAVSSDAAFSGTTMQAECAGAEASTWCTVKAGVTYDNASSSLRLPGSAGHFQAPAGSAVPQNVFFATAADFDRDGWDDFVAADDDDMIFVMRNQTITCSGSACSGTTSVAPSVQTVAPSFWNSLSATRPAAFRFPTTTSSNALIPLKDKPGPTNVMSSMVAGDFDGDGWPDVAVISSTYRTGDVAWPTAARLYHNTQNCRRTADGASPRPCGVGTTCSGQPANGACTGTGLIKGTPFAETNLSCTSTNRCPYFFPTFATYDLRTGAAVTANSPSSATSTTAVTQRPGDFGPMGHAVQNITTVDWDGDGDLDILYGNSAGTCPSGGSNLCTTGGRKFYAGISVWTNSCAQSPQWNAVARSCIGHIPRFDRPFAACTGTSCNDPAVLLPSTAHNTTTLAPNTNLGFDVDHREVPAFAYVDIDKDQDLDLVIGSPGCCSSSANARNRLRVFRGTSNSPTVHTLDTANPLSLSTSHGSYPGFEGSLTGVFVHDFSDDGWPDIITGSDAFGYNGALGGRTRYWKSTGNPSALFGKNWPACSATPASCAGCSATCNPDPTTRISESCGSTSCSKNLTATPPRMSDFDIGFMLDYDHDPQRTRDMVLTNGNNTDEAYIFPNRATAGTVAACGSVASGTLPTPANELTVSGACLRPSATVPAGTAIAYYLTNESPTNYQLACTQTASGFTPALVGGQCCVTFPNITGRSITWKAELDSNTSDGPGVCTEVGTTTPTLSSITANYTYTAATQHYKAGVVTSDGVSYVGSFTQPGNRGHVYALAAGDGATYFDVADKLDAQGTRRVYTSDLTGVGLSAIPFSPLAPDTTLQGRIGAADPDEASTVINWVLSPRFGLNNAGYPTSRLGAVMNSTPAILNRPFRPNWYSFLTTADKILYDTFATAQADRIPLALFASMDGMIHAVISMATAITDTRNGTEAWAFVPPHVAANMTSDYHASCTPNCATGELTVTSYPDGSPALLDFKKADNTIATAAIVSDGAGSTSVTALDVTDTVSPSYAITPPTPLWSHQPGGSQAGKARSKPGVARVRINGAEKFVVVAGTGIHSADPSKGKLVAGYNLETGALLWQFEMECALTSDITVFDTDDLGEPGSPLVDGFADRAVFADACGYVYKLDPAQDLAGGYMANTGHGTIALAPSNGKARFALFVTTLPAALGAGGERPIVGTIGARADATTDIVLFFGTGGLESFDPTKPNEFYAVYARNGALRNKVTGTCTAGRCAKFYGGVVVTPETVIVQRSIDPVIGGGTCDFGKSSVQGYSLSAPYAAQFDVSEIEGQPIAAVSGPLYGDAGALYFATVSGEIKRIGAPRAATAGADTAAGVVHGTGSPETSFSNTPFTLVGWRVVL